jgi:hypothetical protein
VADRPSAPETRIREALRKLLAAAEAEVGPKTTDPEKDAEYWANLGLNTRRLEYQIPGVQRRIVLAQAVLFARAALFEDSSTKQA